MIFGGFSTTSTEQPLPVGAVLLAPGSAAWRLGDGPATALATAGGYRRVLVLGHCGAGDFELSLLAEAAPPPDVTWRWPGTYTVVEETPAGAVVHTDPASAQPVYATRWRGGWAWSTSSRLLASLIGAVIDTQRLACAVFLPSVPALAAGRSFFADVDQLAPGARTELPSDGTAWRVTTSWRPEPVRGRPADVRLRDALAAAVTLRTVADPAVSSDLSGGLDSTSVTVLAATALPAGHRLNAVTVHPDGDIGGADLHHARLAAASHPYRIAHHLLPLTDKHLPYTAITDVPVTDEPAPSTLTRARLTGQLEWMRDELGTRTHLTGDGGDSILFQPPIHLADLIRHHRLGRATGEAFGWARLRHIQVGPLLRDAARTARTTRDQALVALAHAVGTPGRNDHGKVAWFPLLPHPAWAGDPAAGLLAEAARQAAAVPDQLPGLDFAVRVLVDEIREVARTAAADVQLAAASGVDLHSPFLDPLVVDAVLTTPLGRRPPPHVYKPVLARAMSGLLPPETAARATKGSFDADHYTGLRANQRDLSALADSYLAALGLLRPGPFRRHLAQAAAGLPMPLATLEQALTVEAWLAAHHRDPAPTWTVPTGSDPRG
ncbi:albusnodin/ikarugamycin family macrolactam cyclase [Kitasatospora sp. NPDC091207]|uniref:albusnodin/ikarugamycin family macrolactam cyclase n=1 Tax=Kitasatospora sp. NPDC091207 TaxID=3364083 RepID=UPI0038211D89